MAATADADLRVMLGPWQPLPGDAEWLGEACAAIDAGKSAVASAETSAALSVWAGGRWPGVRLLDIATVGGARVGFIAWREPSGFPGAAAIEAVAIRRELRNLGYGAEAVELLEATLPAVTVFSATRRSNGLALYFWLRVGFRPVRLDEVGWMALDPDRFWMVSAEGWCRRPGVHPAR